MSQPFRLPCGGRIDRSKPLSVTFNGKRLDGYRGDTVASMLLASGSHLAGRSFKYHRPRGILTHGSDEPNALLSVDWRPEKGAGRRDRPSRYGCKRMSPNQLHQSGKGDTRPAAHAQPCGRDMDIENAYRLSLKIIGRRHQQSTNRADQDQHQSGPEQPQR